MANKAERILDFSYYLRRMTSVGSSGQEVLNLTSFRCLVGGANPPPWGDGNLTDGVASMRFSVLGTHEGQRGKRQGRFGEGVFFDNLARLRCSLSNTTTLPFTNYKHTYNYKYTTLQTQPTNFKNYNLQSTKNKLTIKNLPISKHNVSSASATFGKISKAETPGEISNTEVRRARRHYNSHGTHNSGSNAAHSSHTAG